MEKPRTLAAALVLVTALIATGCSADTGPLVVKTPNANEPKQPASQEEPSQTDPQAEDPASGQEDQPADVKDPAKQEPSKTVDTSVYTRPDSLTVLVNKQYGLPKDYKPADLVNDPDVPFIFSGYDDRRLMRKEVAEATKKMFAAAAKENIYLAGVSAYRSYDTQAFLFNSYVQTQGEAEARRYSAVPGHSEHQTGLAVDVSGSSGVCAAEDCFADTPEAKWVAAHGHEYGFIIRYPKGKESITGYAYEPWHLRYVGVEMAREIVKQGVTLEEYVYEKVPVMKQITP